MIEMSRDDITESFKVVNIIPLQKDRDIPWGMLMPRVHD
jgi:hypothetical protein